ncbi:50S ribosomal protein L25/general stress protein Ctc [Mangrovibacterium diazotrophicum]|uniref:Large ribosomal subunit protein bL25 n=1 Tax=Mangrovibacterium diazotrophicum TaxID=1261403 RepID=A0A419VWH7_9BACT|nr:50S ribosomal protein L25/general stress protein Ctc [Mangrovibacterium diazotrophicum]RKD86426.1 large subunit ribosomal protein L25 [Mangrovibacterium diazotrophicum]
MKSVAINGELRSAIGKKDSKKLRAEEKVPCVLYGGEEPIHFQADAAEFRKIVYTPNVYLINLTVDGKEHTAIMQDIQWHAVEEQILHIDFLKVDPTKPIKVEVPVKVEGYAKGMRAGGKMKLNLRRLKVKGLATDLPDSIKLNIDHLELGQSIKVGQISVDNLEIMNSKSIPAVTIMITRAARAAMNAAAAATPAKGKKK